MIKKIIQIADVHIPNIQKEEEYEERLQTLVNLCDHELADCEPSETRIVICGDLVHQKNNICNELLVKTSEFLRKLGELTQTVYVIAGNHDFVESNTSRMDTLTALFATMGQSNVVFLDGYFHNTYTEDFMNEGDVTTPYSGILLDDNVSFILYSIMGEGKYKYENPLVSERIINNRFSDEEKQQFDQSVKFGLFHGEVDGASKFNGFNFESNIKLSHFNHCDYVLAGDNHKRQLLKNGEMEFVYSGSPIQQDFGESVLEHGIAVWSLDETSEQNEYKCKFVDMPESPYAAFNFVINDLSDFDNNKEILTNYN